MPRYIRAYIPGGSYFFTVGLLEQIWQRRFWEHCIRDQNDFNTHVDYIHYNPVKHGWVSHVIDCPYSSFHKFVRSGIYPLEWSATTDVRELDLE